jgi:hypothetical protein
MKVLFRNEEFTLDVIGQFEDQSPALQLTQADGGPYARISFCAHDGSSTFPATEGCFWLKDWSENEEIAKHLLAEGLVELTGREIPAGFVTYKEAKLIV